MTYANKEGADQPMRMRSLISAFIVHCPGSMMHILVKPKTSRLQRVSVAELAGLSLTWKQTPEDRFSHNMAHITDAAKRKALPVWIREGLEKMEREKQKKLEKEAKARQQEEEKAAKEQAAKEAEEELERENENSGEPRLPRKSRFVSKIKQKYS